MRAACFASNLLLRKVREMIRPGPVRDLFRPQPARAGTFLVALVLTVDPEGRCLELERSIYHPQSAKLKEALSRG